LFFTLILPYNLDVPCYFTIDRGIVQLWPE
jgi:hypothetical protein